MRFILLLNLKNNNFAKKYKKAIFCDENTLYIRWKCVIGCLKMYNVVIGKVLKQGLVATSRSRRVFLTQIPPTLEFPSSIYRENIETNVPDFRNFGQLPVMKNSLAGGVVSKGMSKIFQEIVSKITALVLKKLPPNLMETLKENPVEILKYVEKYVVKHLTKRIIKDGLSEIDLGNTDDISKQLSQQFEEISSKVAEELSTKIPKVIDDIDTKALKNLKTDIATNAKEILTLSNNDLLELYATSLKANQKECLSILFNKIRNNELSPKEFNQFLDIITTNGKIKTEEIEDLHKSITNIKNTIADINKKKPQNNIDEIDVALVHRLKGTHNVSDEVCGSCYTFLTKLEKEKLSDLEKERIYNILFGDESQESPSIFSSLGITENKNCFKNLSKLLGLKDNMRVRAIVRKYQNGPVLEKGFVEKVADYFNASSVNELPEKMKRNPIDIERNLSDIQIQQITPNIHLNGTERIKIDKNTIRHMPQKYIDNLNRGEYDIKFLSPVETYDTLLRKYGGNSGCNITGVQKGRTYDVEIRIGGGSTGDRLLGTYDPKTGTISFDVFSQGGLHSNNTDPSQFFGPKICSRRIPTERSKMEEFQNNPVKFCLAFLSNFGLLFYNQKKDKELVNEVHYQERGFI